MRNIPWDRTLHDLTSRDLWMPRCPVDYGFRVERSGSPLPRPTFELSTANHRRSGTIEPSYGGERDPIRRSREQPTEQSAQISNLNRRALWPSVRSRKVRSSVSGRPRLAVLRTEGTCTGAERAREPGGHQLTPSGVGPGHSRRVYERSFEIGRSLGISETGGLTAEGSDYQRARSHHVGDADPLGVLTAKSSQSLRLSYTWFG